MAQRICYSHRNLKWKYISNPGFGAAWWNAWAVAIPSQHGAVGPSDGRRHKKEQRRVCGVSHGVPLQIIIDLLCGYSAVPNVADLWSSGCHDLLHDSWQYNYSYHIPALLNRSAPSSWNASTGSLGSKLATSPGTWELQDRVIRVGHRVGIVQICQASGPWISWERRTAWLQWYGLLRLRMDARIKAAEALRAPQGVTCQRSKRSMAWSPRGNRQFTACNQSKLDMLDCLSFHFQDLPRLWVEAC